MKLLLACILATPLLAQAPAADPISGTWTGVLGPNGGGLSAVTMQLKFDGKSVSGTAQGSSPAVIKNGIFDPATGSLKMEAEVQGNPTVLVFEGTVVQSAVTGRLSSGNQAGIFRLAKASEADTGAILRHGFGEVSGWVTKAADLVTADKYNYRPVDSVRTYGQILAHIADSYNYYCSRGAGRNVQWTDTIEKGGTDKATLAPKLAQAVAACNTSYAGFKQEAPLMANIAHANLHYGNLVTYIRMLGLVPPSN